MDLLNPHLANLSQFWLAALKDYAYLCLSPEFNSQLPSTGGTFYTVNVMDIVKPYYEVNWSSLLHAAAIWLKMKGVANKREESDPSPSKPLPPKTSKKGIERLFVSVGDDRIDNFHLVLGLAVQSLCISATLDQPLTLTDCLNSLKILVSSSFARHVLINEDQLPIELLSVLQRVLLTCQSKSLQVLALKISHLIGDCLLQAAPTQGSKHTEDGTEWSNSCSYAFLKVSACCLLRLVPGLNSLDSPTMPPALTDTLTKDDHTIISLSLTLLVTSSSLCFRDHHLNFLPSIFHMLLYTLQFISRVPLSAGSSAAGLQALKEICNSLQCADEQVGLKRLEIVRSVLASVLETQSGSQSTVVTSHTTSYPDMEKETRLLVVTILLLMPTSSVNLIPAQSELFEGCVHLLSQSMASSRVKVSVSEQLCVCVRACYF